MPRLSWLDWRPDYVRTKCEIDVLVLFEFRLVDLIYRLELTPVSDKLERFKREVRADLQLVWAGQADGNKRLNEMSQRINDCGQQIAEQGQQIAEQGQRIAEQGQLIALQSTVIADSMRETAKLGKEVVAIGEQTVGRLKQFDRRFGKFIDALDEEMETKAPLNRLEALEQRVRELEDRQGPAA